MKLEYVNESPDSITGARALTPASSSSVLHQIISECKHRIVMFDLDSTLIDNRTRNARIMREFGALNNIAILGNAKPEHWHDWSVQNAMSNIGLSALAIESIVEPFNEFWTERFFTSHYCKYDTEVTGAVNFVTDVQRSGGIIRYLTGRHEAMRTGTLNSLRSLGFPVPESDDVALIMKPEQSIPDDEYKQQALVQFDTKSGILAAFDNEPEHINSYRVAFPKATCIHLQTDHSLYPARLLGGIVSIADFTR